MNLIKRYPQATFWLFAWATSFFGWYMYTTYPSMVWILFLYGPLIGGVIVSAASEGRQGLKTYFSRMVRWRVGMQWYLVAVFAPVVLRLAAVGLNLLFGASLAPNPEIPPLSEHLMGILFPSLLLIALAEEPGFRGYALPKLLEGRSALSAALILGVLHAIWHIPLFIFGADTPGIVPIIIAGSVLNTWLFVNSNGSVLPNIILHTSVDRMVYIFNPLFGGADAASHLIWLNVAYVALAILLPLVFGKELGRKPAAGVRAVPVERPLAVK